MFHQTSGVLAEVLAHGLHTCEHGTEVGTTRRKDHPVSWYFNAPRHQLDITQDLLAETAGPNDNGLHYLDKNLHAKRRKTAARSAKL